MNQILEGLKYLSGFLTPLLGIIATAVIVMQYVLQKNKWKLDLFDKRYPIYDATKKYLASIAQEAKITHNELFDFLRNTKDSNFLFGTDVNDFLKLLYKKGVDLAHIGRVARTATIENQRLKAIDDEHYLLNWFSEQFDEANKVFGKYLKIDSK